MNLIKFSLYLHDIRAIRSSVIPSTDFITNVSNVSNVTNLNRGDVTRIPQQDKKSPMIRMIIVFRYDPLQSIWKTVRISLIETVADFLVPALQLDHIVSDAFRRFRVEHDSFEEISDRIHL